MKNEGYQGNTPENASDKPHDRAVTPEEMNRLPGRENNARRTRSGKLFSLGRNLYQAVLYPDPVHYRDRETGQWQEIDNTLIPVTDNAGETYLTNRRNDEMKVELHPAGDAAMVLLEDEDGRMVSWQLEGAQNVQPRLIARPCFQHKDCDLRRDVLDHLEDEAVYDNILPGVDLICRVQSVSFKDDLLFATRESAQPLSFLLSTPDMVPSIQGGELQIIAPTGEIPFVLPAPFLKDHSAENSLGEVAVSLEPTGERDVWRMTYTPDAAWLDTAEFPVVLDPAVISKKHSSAVEDNYVTSAQPNTVQPYAGTNMKVSYAHSTWGTSRAFIKFVGSGLPEIDSSCYITKAYFSVASQTTPTYASSIYLKEALSDWSSSALTYNNAPALNSMALDYMYMETGGAWYTYDISNLVRKWYAGTNYGFALESATSTHLDLYTSDHPTVKPYVTINYVSLAGLEDYLAYEDQPVGRAGTGHVSLYNGNLIFEHQDTVCSGSRLPLSVTRYYNSCYYDLDAFRAGYGWKSSLDHGLYKQTLPGISGNVTYYVYIDGDGTQHYFQQTSGVWKDLSGLSLTLTLSGDMATIKDKADNALVFFIPTDEFNGDYQNVSVLQEMRDAQGNVATMGTVNGRQGRQLICAIDGANRRTNYSILEDGRTGSILAPGQTEETGVHFLYDGSGKLIQISHEDGKTTSYAYNALGLLETVTDVDGLRVTYEYYDERKPYRVKKITVSNGDVIGNSRLYEYRDCLTVVTDLTVPNGKKLYYHFNDYGNVISVNDELGYTCFAKYSDSLPINSPEVTSKMQRVVSNYLKNHSFEGNEDWYFYVPTSGNSAGYATDSYYGGSRSAKISIGSNLGFASASQLVTLEKGKTYTFSFFARRTGNADARIQINIGDYVVSSAGYATELTSSYQRFSYTFTVPENASTDQARIYLVAENAVGSVWFDCVQLEQGPLMNRYNVLVNGDFSFNLSAPQGWKANASNTSMDAVYATYDGIKPEGLTANTFRMYGTGRTKYAGIYQDLSLSGKKGDVFTAGGWSLNHSKPRKGENFRYNIRVSFLPVSGGSRVDTPSIEWSEEWSDWQFAAGPVVAPCDYSYVRFNVDYERNINYTDFDGFFMHREEFGQTYQYDSKGNLLSTKNLASQQDAATYDSFDNLTSYRQPGRASAVKTTLEYGSTDAEKKKHLIKKSTSPLGIVQTFTHDSAGNPTENKVTAATSTLFMQSSTAYSADQNYPATQTDMRGKVSKTEYDPVRGTLCAVEDANAQRVEYAYDPLSRLTLTSATAEGKTCKNEYAYSDANCLTQVKHNTTDDSACDVEYTFGYDTLNNPTTVKIGSQLLSSNVYTDTGDKMLQRVEYGNGGKVHYSYDAFKRVVGMSYDNEESDRYRYEFGANGQLGKLHDLHLSRTLSYGYDTANRLMRVQNHSEQDLPYITELEYDVFDNLSSFKESMGTRQYTTTYAYDNENRPLSMQYGSASNQVAYAYDALGQTTTRTLTLNGRAYATTYDFVPGGHGTGSVSALVEKITQANHSFTYAYDEVGHISGETRNTQTTTYGYDALGQLVRVNDPYENKTYLYSYDRGGNILTASSHAYTLENAVGTAEETHSYLYGDPNWKDKLTSFDGKAITYDAIGNPLTYDGWTYAWQAGRQLAHISNAAGTLNFQYNHDGLRVRKSGMNGTTNYLLHGKQILEADVNGNRLHFFYDAQGRPAIVEFNGNRYGYVHNLQGDVVALVNATGATVVEYRYDAWGLPLGKSGSMADTLGIYNPFRYRGYVYDEETGYYITGTRYYNPTFKRFISPDEVHIVKASQDYPCHDKNLFAYCDNNPIVREDKDGYFWNIIAGAIGGAILGAAVNILDNLTSGKKWSDGVGTAMLTGAASGALAASGVGLAASVMGNGAISMIGNATNQVIKNRGFDNFDMGDMLADGLIGGISGAAGGRGMSKSVNLKTLNKNLTKKVFSGSVKTVVKGAKYYVSQTSKLYWRHLAAPMLKSSGTALVGSNVKRLLSK